MRPQLKTNGNLRSAALLGLALLASSCSSNPGRLTGPGGTGKHLVVFSTDRGAATGQFKLVLYDLDALAFRTMKNLAVPGATPMLNPIFSSDGLLIAFQSETGGAGNDDIYIYGRSAAAMIATPGLNTDSSETEPAFTGDIQKLLFVRKWNGYRHIRVYDPVIDSVLVPSGLDTLATYDDWSPSPDRTGARFAFVSNRNGNPDIFVYNSGTLMNIPELRSAGSDIEPSLTPDGRWLCFASDRAGGAGLFDLYLYDLSNSVMVTLAPTVNTAMNERRPSIGAAGTVISFQSDRVGGFGLWDIWNYRRSDGSVGQGAGQESTANDVGPSLYWP